MKLEKLPEGASAQCDAMITVGPIFIHRCPHTAYFRVIREKTDHLIADPHGFYSLFLCKECVDIINMNGRDVKISVPQ